MPFPLAHPAAVLPLRRVSWLNFPALVIGSIAPDLAYCSFGLHLEEFAHTILGAVGFALPVGLLLYWGLYKFAHSRFSQRLGTRRIASTLVPLASPRNAVILAASIFLGALTHVIWDGFTHKQGWFVRHWPLLQMPIASIKGHPLRVFHLLWYACSFVGVAWLYVAYERWKNDPSCATPGEKAPGALVLRSCAAATLAVLLGLVHHLLVHWQNLIVAGLLGLSFMAGVIVWLGYARKKLA